MVSACGRCRNSRIPRPLLALMERPGSLRFFAKDGILTEPLNPDRLSWARTFYRSESEIKKIHWRICVQFSPSHVTCAWCTNTRLVESTHITPTIGKSLRICMPSPGPMWATWLKLVGLEISLLLFSGSLSISLKKHTQDISKTLQPRSLMLLRMAYSLWYNICLTELSYKYWQMLLPVILMTILLKGNMQDEQHQLMHR